MLDPLTSLGLATNVVQLVDFGLRVAKIGHQICKNGSTEEHQHLDEMSERIKRLCVEVQQNLRLKQRGQITSNLPTENEEPRYDHPIENLALRTRRAAEELSMMLDKLKIEDVQHPASSNESPNNTPTRKRKRDAVNRVVKAVWKDADVQKLRKQLGELQQELILNLTVLQSQPSSTILGEIGHSHSDVAYQNDRLKQFEQLEEHRAKVLAHAARIDDSLDTDGTPDMLASLFDSLSAQIQSVSKCQRILHTLSFKEILQRQENITQPHRNTFDWVFTNPALGFTEWAAEKDGIFWVTGKPGSGKSTLMKYLLTDERTSQCLRTWAGENELTLTSHFFWNSGTAMQKSQIGLLRTLLFNIIRQCPDKAVELVPQRFQLQDVNGFGVMPWTLPELCKTLEAFGQQQDMGIRLCFFLDGLDEYCDEEHGEFQDLVDYLFTLSKCPSFKLCISSRPWNVFSRAYNKKVDGQLAVQALTRSDIQLYVNDTMQNSPQFRRLRASHAAACTDLVNEISRKAQGVFLWVRLAVRSLLRGMTNDDSIEILRERLLQYPEKLNDFFQRMFDRIEPVYHRTSARILLVALKAERPLNYAVPRFLEQEGTDREYALKLSVSTDAACPKSYEIEACTSYLDARSAELLELTAAGICLIHRTARDFLERKVVIDKLIAQAGVMFDAGLSLASAILANIKTGSAENEGINIMVQDILSYEQIVRAENMDLFAKIVQDLHHHGGLLFSVRGATASYFAETKDGLSLIETHESYDDSLLSIYVRSNLARLQEGLARKAPQPPEPVSVEFSEIDSAANEAADFKYLFSNTEQENENVTWSSIANQAR